MDEQTKSEIKQLLKEVIEEENRVNETERSAYRRKVDDLLICIKGDENLGVRGLAEDVKCLLRYKNELQYVLRRADEISKRYCK